MANTLTTCGYTQLANIALDAFTSILTPISELWTTNAGYSNVTLGDYVRVPFYSAMSASAQEWSGTVSTGSATVTGLDVQLAYWTYVPFHLSDKEMADNPVVSLERIARQAGEGLAWKVLDNVISTVCSSSFGNGGTTPTTFGFAQVNNLYVSGSELKWPLSERNLVVSPALYGKVVADTTTIANASAYGSVNPVQYGRLQSIAGFENILQTSVLPRKHATTSETVNGFACTPNSILFASRVIQPGSEAPTVTSYETVTNPGTGLTLGYRRYYDNTSRKTVGSLEFSYGFRVGDSTALYILR